MNFSQARNGFKNETKLDKFLSLNCFLTILKVKPNIEGSTLVGDPFFSLVLFKTNFLLKVKHH